MKKIYLSISCGNLFVISFTHTVIFLIVLAVPSQGQQLTDDQQAALTSIKEFVDQGICTESKTICETNFCGSEIVSGCNYKDFFPDAQYPFVVAPNGCDYLNLTGFPENQLAELTTGIFDFDRFREACNHHDRCYYLLGSTADECNREFGKRLLAACASAEIKRLCEIKATGIYLAVQAAAPIAFTESQSFAREFKNYLENNCTVDVVGHQLERCREVMPVVGWEPGQVQPPFFWCERSCRGSRFVYSWSSPY